MKIFITGTAGFIGFHLATKFLNEGFEVVGIDSINDYYDINLKYGRLAEAGIEKDNIVYNNVTISTKYPGYRFYNLLLEDEAALNEIFKTENPQIVVNLAAQAGVRYSLENPGAYIKSNVEGFLNLLECCRRFKIQHLVYASSSSIYGLNSGPVFSVEDSVNHPISLYAATKRSNELMAHVYSHLFKLPTTGVRFFTVYGPWGRPDMAPMIFTKAISEEKPISVYNNGNMSRDFTYVDDVVESVFRLVDVIPAGKPDEYQDNPLPSNSPAPFAIYNIGNHSPVKLIDFIETIEHKLNKKAIKEFKPIQPGDVVSTYADVNSLIEDTGYKPQTTLKEGISKFVDWYREFYN
ncbi:NAD-dependent epimerase [Mucilaginibacter endophyticus]|uniref:NAD-dependent epimerase n=1 Tax=Mucilaginibacter endophyticus TaxID=2675003 RepID=UPI000E0D28FA|nr:NAD-dependent epimerase [Mucilaginibacter endophyticus]